MIYMIKGRINTFFRKYEYRVTENTFRTTAIEEIKEE